MNSDMAPVPTLTFCKSLPIFRSKRHLSCHFVVVGKLSVCRYICQMKSFLVCFPPIKIEAYYISFFYAYRGVRFHWMKVPSSCCLSPWSLGSVVRWTELIFNETSGNNLAQGMLIIHKGFYVYLFVCFSDMQLCNLRLFLQNEESLICVCTFDRWILMIIHKSKSNNIVLKHFVHQIYFLEDL